MNSANTAPIREGWDINGWPATTILRGKVMVENGQFFGDLNGGRSIPRRLRQTFATNRLHKPKIALILLQGVFRSNLCKGQT